MLLCKILHNRCFLFSGPGKNTGMRQHFAVLACHMPANAKEDFYKNLKYCFIREQTAEQKCNSMFCRFMG